MCQNIGITTKGVTLTKKSNSNYLNKSNGNYLFQRQHGDFLKKYFEIIKKKKFPLE